ncbi:MAG: hypothetical protein ACOCU0_02580 [Bacillota bacterium]
MTQFNLILQDYANWKMENVEILERFKHNDSIIYDRLEPVYAVLNHIYEMALEEELSEDFQTIFQVGLNYLHSQFEVIRIYYEKLFNSDCDVFEEFAPLVGYLLFISDFRADLEEYEELIDFEPLDEVETMIENMIAERDERFEYAAEQLNKTTKKIVDQLDFQYVSIIDIYVEIAENLGISLSTDAPLIIGEDV